MTIVEISSFRGPYAFLSNFYPAYVKLDDIEVPTVEHGYQLGKEWPRNAVYVERILACATAKEAKAVGKLAQLRPDWDTVKLSLMENLLRQKFSIGDALTDLLLATGNAILIEGNYWGDRYWGECPVGTGQNNLGRLLMKLRGEWRALHE